MNLLRAAEFKVGLLVLAVAGLIAYMSLQVSDDPSFMGRTNEAWFLLDDAGGLVKNSSVRTAGISMGIIKDIKLQDGRARVDISVRPDVKLHVSATVEIKSQGILGDKHVELSPGSLTDPPLPPRGQILNVKDKGNLDSIVSQVGDIAGNFKEVAQILKESIAHDGTREHVLGRIVLNIEKLTKDIADMTGENKTKINDIIDQVNGITETLDDALNDESEEGFKKVWKRTLARVDSTMKNVDEITGKINRGEGTIGKLVSDEETAEKVSNAVDGIANLIDTGTKMSTAVDISAAYMGNAGSADSNINVIIQPGPDRYYLLGVESDPYGFVTRSSTVDTGTVNNNYSEVQTNHTATKLNAEFAKIFYDFTIRGGLIGSYGGIGMDYTFLNKRATASVDLYNFTQLNVRPSIKYQVWKGLYVYGGFYDAANKSGNVSNYLGAGLFLTNDDLKLFLSKMSL